MVKKHRLVDFGLWSDGHHPASKKHHDRAAGYTDRQHVTPTIWLDIPGSLSGVNDLPLTHVVPLASRLPRGETGCPRRLAHLYAASARIIHHQRRPARRCPRPRLEGLTNVLLRPVMRILGPPVPPTRLSGASCRQWQASVRGVLSAGALCASVDT